MGYVSWTYERNVKLIRKAIREHFPHWEPDDTYLKPLKSWLFLLHKEGEESHYLFFADELLDDDEFPLTAPDLEQSFSNWKGSKKIGVRFARERSLWPEYLDDPENDYKRHL